MFRFKTISTNDNYSSLLPMRKTESLEARNLTGIYLGCEKQKAFPKSKPRTAQRTPFRRTRTPTEKYEYQKIEDLREPNIYRGPRGFQGKEPKKRPVTSVTKSTISSTSAANSTIRHSYGNHSYTAVHNSGVSHWEDLNTYRDSEASSSEISVFTTDFQELMRQDDENVRELVHCFQKVCQTQATNMSSLFPRSNRVLSGKPSLVIRSYHVPSQGEIIASFPPPPSARQTKSAFTSGHLYHTRQVSFSALSSTPLRPYERHLSRLNTPLNSEQQSLVNLEDGLMINRELGRKPVHVTSKTAQVAALLSTIETKPVTTSSNQVDSLDLKELNHFNHLMQQMHHSNTSKDKEAELEPGEEPVMGKEESTDKPGEASMGIGAKDPEGRVGVVTIESKEAKEEPRIEVNEPSKEETLQELGDRLVEDTIPPPGKELTEQPGEELRQETEEELRQEAEEELRQETGEEPEKEEIDSIASISKRESQTSLGTGEAISIEVTNDAGEPLVLDIDADVEEDIMDVIPRQRKISVVRRMQKSKELEAQFEQQIKMEAANREHELAQLLQDDEDSQ